LTSLHRLNTSKVNQSHFIDIIGSSQYSLTDLKKTLLELKIQGQINDTIKKCAGYIFQIKIGQEEEIIAEWLEDKSAASNGKIMKKIRFPLKFEHVNSNV
jgi:hypothetical protein